MARIRPACFGGPASGQCVRCEMRSNCIEFRLRPIGFGFLARPRFPVVYVDERPQEDHLDLKERACAALREAGYRKRAEWWMVGKSRFLRLLTAIPGHVSAHFRDVWPTQVEDVLKALDRRSTPVQVSVRPAEFSPEGTPGTPGTARRARRTALGSIVSVADVPPLLVVAAAIRALLECPAHG